MMYDALKFRTSKDHNQMMAQSIENSFEYIHKIV